jgi:sorbitol-specific phosphotransferase system component IIA
VDRLSPDIVVVFEEKHADDLGPMCAIFELGQYHLAEFAGNGVALAGKMYATFIK